MVGWLVEHDEVRFLQEQLSESHTRLLTSGECGNFLVKLIFLKAESLQDASDFALAGVTVDILEPVCHGCVFPEQEIELVAGGVFHVRFRLADRRLKVENLLFDCEQFVEDCVLTVHGLMLGEIAETPVLCEGHTACIGRKSARDDFEQCGFACTIDADDRCFFIILYMKRSVFDDMVVHESFVYVIA